MTAARGNRSGILSRGGLSVTTSTLAFLAIACAPSTARAQTECDPGGGPYTSGSPLFNGGMTGGCEVNAGAADTFGGTVAADFRNGAVLNANAANAVSGGLVQLSTYDAVVNANVANAVSGGTLVVNGTVNAQASGAINGARLRIGGDGVINIRAFNATTVNTDVEFGSQAVSAGGLLNLDGHDTVIGRITNYIPSGQILSGAANAVLTIDGSVLGDSSFGGALTDGAGGTLALVKRGASTLTLSGANSYSGGTWIDGGTLRLTGNGSLGAPGGSLSIDGGATLAFDSAALMIGSLSGAGTIVRYDRNPGVLTVDLASDSLFDGAISSYFDEIDGVTSQIDLIKTGAGELALLGNNSYNGTTTVAGGSLVVDGTLGNLHWGPIEVGGTQVVVASGGRLLGGGSIEGSVSVASGGTLLGLTGITLTMRSLALDSGSIVNAELGAPSTAPLFNVTGNLTLAGTLNVSDGGGFGAGLYRLFDYGGALTNNGMSIGATPAGYTAGDLTVQTSVANQVNLLVGASANPGAYAFWNGTQTAPNNIVNGGAGTWSAAGTNWTDAGGGASGVYDPAAMLIFQGAPGVVTVDAGGGALGVGGGMQFFADGYKVTGGALNLAAAATPIRVGDGTAAGAGMTAIIASSLTGSGGLDKTDLGTLRLWGANNYTGGTTISAGALILDGGTLGGGPLTIASGGTLDLAYPNDHHAGTLSGAGTITIGGHVPSNLLIEQAADAVFSGAIVDGSGWINFTKAGAGVLMLTGDSTFNALHAEGGALAIRDGAHVVNASGTVGDVNGHGNISGGDGTVLVTGSGTSWTIAGVGNGNHPIQVAGDGTLTVENGGTVHAEAIALDGALNLNGTAGARGVLETHGIDGSSGASLAIDGGILRAIASSAYSNFKLLQNFAGATIAAGGAYIDTNGNDAVIDVPFGGVGALVKQGAGALLLLGANDHAGGTAIEAGSILLGVNGGAATPSGTLGAGPLSVAAGAMLDLGGTSQTVSALSGAGAITSTILGNVSLLTVDQASDTTFSGVISDGFDPVDGGTAKVGLAVRGGGILTLSGANDYTGPTTIQGGGEVRVNGSIASPVIVNSGGALSGTGAVYNAVTLNHNGVLAGEQGQTLTMGGLTLNDGAVVVAVLGAPATTELFKVQGDLTLAGTSILDVSATSGFGEGLYRLISYDGSLTGSGGLTIDPAANPGWTLEVQTSVANQVNLLVGGSTTPVTPVTPVTPPAFAFWNGANTAANGTIAGGDGTWSASGANWTDANGATALPWTGTFAIFQGAPGNVTVDASAGAVAATGIQFIGQGWNVTGDPLTLAGDGGSTTIRVGDGTAAGAGDLATIGSVLAGDTRLVKDDLGTLVLIGANSYTGGTWIKAGALRIGAGGAITGPVADDGTLIFDRADAYDFASVISGAGAIRQIGAGRTNLTGDSSGFTGSTSIENGTLAVNGKLGGALDVLAGGRLQGIGTVGGTIVHGTVAPGNSIGTLNVAGNIGFAAGSIYEVEVNVAGQSDRIVAGGAASIAGGTVKVLAGAGNYKPQTDYTILTAAGGVSGTFASVTSNLAFLDPSLGYDAGNVYLRLRRNDISFADIGLTPNQIATGGATGALGWGNPVFDAAVNLSANQARGAFDQLSGEIHASARTAMLEDSRYIRGAMLDRLRDAPEDDHGAVWGQAIGSWGHVGGNGNGNAARLDRSVAGLLIGIDRASDTLRLGVAGGYDRTNIDVDRRGASGKVESYHLAAYAGGRWGAIALRTGLGYAWQGIRATRTIAFPGFTDRTRARYDGGTFQAFGELGYGLDLGATRLEPFAGLAYVRARSDAFDESGGGAALSGAKASTDVTFSTLGLRTRTRFEKAMLRADAGWRHAFGDVVPVTAMRYRSGGGVFATGGVPFARDAATVDLGLDVAVSGRIGIGLSYDGQFGRRFADHGVRATLDVRF